MESGEEEQTEEICNIADWVIFLGLSEQFWMLKSQLWNVTGKPELRCPKLTL